jgi:hypothetical protein
LAKRYQIGGWSTKPDELTDLSRHKRKTPKPELWGLSRVAFRLSLGGAVMVVMTMMMVVPARGESRACAYQQQESGD